MTLLTHAPASSRFDRAGGAEEGRELAPRHLLFALAQMGVAGVESVQVGLQPYTVGVPTAGDTGTTWRSATTSGGTQASWGS